MLSYVFPLNGPTSAAYVMKCYEMEAETCEKREAV